MLSIENENELLSFALNDGIQKFVVGAFIKNDDKLLIIKRAQGDDFLPNLDEIPGGGVDHKESLAQAIIREVKEETGLIVQSIDRYINHFDYISGSGKQTRQFNFSVSVTHYDVVLNPDEHSGFLWISLKDTEFPELNFSKEMKESIKDFIEK